MKPYLFFFFALLTSLSISCSKRTGETLGNQSNTPQAIPPRNTTPKSLNGTRIFKAWQSDGLIVDRDSTSSNKRAIDDVEIEFNVLTDTTVTVTIKFEDSTIKDQLILNNGLSTLRYTGSNYYRSIAHTSQTLTNTEFYCDTLGKNIPLLIRSYFDNKNTRNEWHFEFKQK